MTQRHGRIVFRRHCPFLYAKSVRCDAADMLDAFRIRAAARSHRITHADYAGDIGDEVNQGFRAEVPARSVTEAVLRRKVYSGGRTQAVLIVAKTQPRAPIFVNFGHELFFESVTREQIALRTPGSVGDIL